MSIAEKLQTIAENEQMVYDAGKRAEYDRFWDAYQPYGANKYGTWYNYAFAGTMWNAETLRPKYDLIANGASYMFAGNRIKNIKQHLESLGIKLDITPATQVNYMFSDSSTTEIGELNMTNVTALTGIFYGAKVVTIDKLILKSDGTNTLSNAFYNATSLANIIIEGVIGTNTLNVQWCPLTHDSLMSFINALQDKSSDTSGTAWKATFGSSNLAKLTDAEKQMIKNKGWDYA